ncbi:hypothetical protein ACM55G_12405 [Flavobacterium sp. LB3P122]|uniref:hypothetical protein n=1 Tax=Flavobacterium algoriphilum TaxID=3398738 RepID=UPI003A87F9F3
MFPKNKILIIIFVIISLYGTGFFLTYSGDLINPIQKIRYENQIKKIKFRQTIIFSLDEWQAFSDKKEIKYNNPFYDMISFKKNHTKVISKAVNYDLENQFRLVISQVLNKHKRFPLEKKRTFLSKHPVQKNKINFGFKIVFKIGIIENHNTQFNLKTRSFIYLLFDPPVKIVFFKHFF